MKRRILISLLVIVVSAILLLIANNNYIYSNNDWKMIFSSNNLTKDERAWLDEKGHLIYSSDYDTPPLRFIEDNSGRYIGIVVDYMEALSLELGVDIKLQPDTWQVALDSLRDGKVDMVDMYPSEKRSEYYYFTNTIFYQNAVMVVKKNDDTIKDVKDLNRKRVAAQTGDFVNEYLNENTPDAIVVNTDDYREAVKLLNDGLVDAVVGDESVINHFLNFYDMKNDFEIHDELLYENTFVLGVPKSQPELVNILNKGIKGLNRKQTLTRIQQKWFGISTPIDNPEGIDKYVIPGIFVIILVVVAGYLFYAWNDYLKKEVEVALEASEMALQTTFDGLTHLMIVLDEKHEIINGNKAFFNTLKLSKSDVLHRPLDDYFDLDLDQDKEYQQDNKFYEVSVHDIDQAGQSHIVMLKDITTKKISERQIMSANKMAAIGQLAAGVAHEIRNPLGLIRNYTYVLKKNHDKELREKSYSMIEKSVERASNIIDNLLNFSRISGIEVAAFNLHDFIQGIIQLHEKSLSSARIETNFVCDASLSVVLNLESMKHIMINLLSNAIDAIGENGLLSIHCYIEQEQLIIKVKDSGCGLTKESLSQLFHPFYTTKPPGEGTGLGLYIVYTEVEKLGGIIDVNSQLDVGTEFTLVFPYKKEQI